MTPPTRALAVLYHAIARAAAIAFIISLPIALSGCSFFGLGGDKSSADSESEKTSATQSEPLHVVLVAGKNLNMTRSGQPLALRVKFYVLRDARTFLHTGIATFLEKGRAKRVFGPAVVKQWQALIVPGRKYSIDVPRLAEYLGVVALFRDPAAGRWRVALSIPQQSKKPVKIGFHGCAMTVNQASIVGGKPFFWAHLIGVDCRK